MPEHRLNDCSFGGGFCFVGMYPGAVFADIGDFDEERIDACELDCFSEGSQVHVSRRTCAAYQSATMASSPSSLIF